MSFENGFLQQTFVKSSYTHTRLVESGTKPNCLSNRNTVACWSFFHFLCQWLKFWVFFFFVVFFWWFGFFMLKLSHSLSSYHLGKVQPGPTTSSACCHDNRVNKQRPAECVCQCKKIETLLDQLATDSRAFVSAALRLANNRNASSSPKYLLVSVDDCWFSYYDFRSLCARQSWKAALGLSNTSSVDFTGNLLLHGVMYCW